VLLPIVVPDVYGVDSVRDLVYRILPDWYEFAAAEQKLAHRPALLPLVMTKILVKSEADKLWIQDGQQSCALQLDKIMRAIDRNLVSPTCSCNGKMTLPLVPLCPRLLSSTVSRQSCAGAADDPSLCAIQFQQARVPLSSLTCCLSDGVEKEVTAAYGAIAALIIAASSKVAAQTTTPQKKRTESPVRHSPYAPPAPKKSKRAERGVIAKYFT
jgi:hypothetical protein